MTLSAGFRTLDDRRPLLDFEASSKPPPMTLSAGFRTLDDRRPLLDFEAAHPNRLRSYCQRLVQSRAASGNRPQGVEALRSRLTSSELSAENS
jgi:hypothetical protein